MEVSGGSFPTTVKNSVHQPTMVCCSRREAGRSNCEIISMSRSARAPEPAHIDSVLVHLQHCAQDLTGLQAGLAGKRVANVEQLWERQGDDPVKICAVLAGLESVDLAYRQQALHTGEDGGNVARVQQLDGHVEEVGPFCGEVVGEDLLEGGDELQADLRRRCDEHRDDAVAEGGLLLLGDGLGLAVFLGGGPALGDAVLEVNDSCSTCQHSGPQDMPSHTSAAAAYLTGGWRAPAPAAAHSAGHR